MVICVVCLVIMFMYLAIDILMNLLFLLSALFLIKKKCLPINLKVLQSSSIILGVHHFSRFGSMTASLNHLSPSSGSILFFSLSFQKEWRIGESVCH